LKKNVILVVNPISGGVDKSEIIDEVIHFSESKGLNAVLYTTSGENDVAKINVLYETHKPERIIVVGGDGTIKLVTEAIQERDVILGIIPAGSANGFALDLDLMLTLEENLSIAFQNNFIELDVIKINGKISLHLSDLGLNAELVKNFEKSTIRGKIGYALHAFTTLMDSDDPFVANILTNNQDITCEATMIVIANSKKYGSGVVINPNGVMNDGKFELIVLKNLDLVVFWQIITGDISIDSEDIEVISCEKAIIKTNFPVSFQMDGEYCGTETKFDIEILHKQIKVAIS